MRHVLFALLCFLCSALSAKKDDTCHDFISKTSFPAHSSHMYLLEKADGSKWLIKQRKGKSLEGQFLCVIETLGARMAESLGIPCNKVELIPSKSCQQYKKFKECPATLHTFFSGISSCYKQVTIYQPYGKKCKDVCGINEQVIKNMAQHPTLSRLVALDTFMAGTDRGCPNLMYDPINQSFYAIDFGSGFSGDLAEVALNNFKNFEQHGISFTQADIQGIKIYRDALDYLARHYKAKDVYTELVKLATYAGFFSKNPSFSGGKKKLKEQLDKYKRFIFKSYGSTLKLIKYLDLVIPIWQSRSQV